MVRNVEELMRTPTWETSAAEGFRRARPEVAPSRLAAIDVGSNSLRLVVAQVERDGTYRILDEEREMTRLSEGLDLTGSLSEQAIERSLQALGKMKAIADGFQVRQLRAIATSAVREASNGQSFRDEALRRLQIPIEVITADDEARFAFRSAARHFKLDGTLTAVVDIGGGSAEVVLAAESMIERVYSLPLGAVRMTERFGLLGRITSEQIKRLRRDIDLTLKEHMGRAPFEPDTMIGSGGTFTTIADIIRCRREGKSDSSHGYLMTVAEVEELFNQLAGMSLEERKRVPGLNPSRADIIVAGAAVILRLARRLGIQQILVNERGIRDGLLLSMIEAQYERVEVASPQPRNRLEWARRFARKCRSDEQHCEHVAALGLQVLDQLQAQFHLPIESRDILHAAGLLHDVGYLINHARHHKHAYHLIMHGELPGFSAREVELIANIARYHRRAIPKKSHSNFIKLNTTDRDLVRKLSGILRVVDGLDRTHTSRVSSIRVEMSEGTVRFCVEAVTDPHVEIWYASGKSDLFEKAFGTNVEFAWVPLNARTSAPPMHPELSHTEQSAGV